MIRGITTIYQSVKGSGDNCLMVVWALWWPFDLFRVCSCLSRLSAVIGCSPPRLSKIYGQLKIETSPFYHFINISAKLISNWPFWELKRHQNKGKNNWPEWRERDR